MVYRCGVGAGGISSLCVAEAANVWHVAKARLDWLTAAYYAPMLNVSAKG